MWLLCKWENAEAKDAELQKMINKKRLAVTKRIQMIYTISPCLRRGRLALALGDGVL